MEKIKEGEWDRDADFEHSFCKVVNKAEKYDQLVEVLLDPLAEAAERTIILVQSRQKADFLAAFLSSEYGLPANRIHEQEEASEMKLALVDFRSGEKPILVVTPALTHDIVLALDTRDVAHLIDYDEHEDIDKLLLLIGYWDNPGKLTTFVEPVTSLRRHGM